MMKYMVTIESSKEIMPEVRCITTTLKSAQDYIEKDLPSAEAYFKRGKHDFEHKIWQLVP